MTIPTRRRAAAATCLALTTVLAATFSDAPTASAAEEVNIYSYREPVLIQPLLEAFTEQTGIRTNAIYINKGLVQRIAAEGTNSPADVILTVDIGRLDAALEAGITQPVKDAEIEANIPASFRDPDGNWFALTTRGRVVYASRERVSQDSITYEELSDPKWKGRICIRSGQHFYNIGLFASMVAHHGVEYTTEWLEGLRDNLARKPGGNDRAQAKGIFSGECDIGIGNTYYVGRMATNDKEPEQKDWAAAIKVLFPNNDGRGTHVNISGMALAAHAPNRENALKLMRFLASEEAQAIYAEQVFEYPVKPGVKVSDIVASWGEVHPDSLPLSEIAGHRKTASEIVDKVGFDDGPAS